MKMSFYNIKILFILSSLLFFLASCKKKSLSELDFAVGHSTFSKNKTHNSLACEELNVCKSTCKKLKKEFSLDQKRCEKQEIGYVEDFELALKALEKSKLRILQDIPYETLEVLYDTDSATVQSILKKAIKGSLISAEGFFAWYASNERVAQLLQQTELLSLVAGQISQGTDHLAFVTHLRRARFHTNKDKNTFLGIAAESDNEVAALVAHKLIVGSGLATHQKARAQQVYCYKSLEDRDEYMNEENLAFNLLDRVFPTSFINEVVQSKQEKAKPFQELDEYWCQAL